MDPSGNPYTLMFGKAPAQIISRASESAQLINAFCNAEQPQKIKKMKVWIVIELNHERDLLHSLQICTSSLPARTRDFHPLERTHGAQTKKGQDLFTDPDLFIYSGIVHFRTPSKYGLCFRMRKSSASFSDQSNNPRPAFCPVAPAAIPSSTVR